MVGWSYVVVSDMLFTAPDGGHETLRVGTVVDRLSDDWMRANLPKDDREAWFGPPDPFSTRLPPSGQEVKKMKRGARAPRPQSTAAHKRQPLAVPFMWEDRFRYADAGRQLMPHGWVDERLNERMRAADRVAIRQVVDLDRDEFVDDAEEDDE